MGDNIRTAKAPLRINKRLRKNQCGAAAAKRWRNYHEAAGGKTEEAADASLTCQPPCGDDVLKFKKSEVASKKKIDAMKAGRDAVLDNSNVSDQIDVPQPPPPAWCIANLAQVNMLLKDVLCPICNAPEGLFIVKGALPAMGFAESLHISCELCSFSSSPVYSSPRCNTEDGHSDPFTINRLMTMLSHEIGKGHEALKKIANIIGVRNMHLKTYQRHQHTAYKASASAALDNVNSAACIIRAMSKDLGDDGLLDLTVSYDGTWHKRGFTSHHGVGVAIEVNTGLVIDREVLSNYCHACALARSRYGKSQEFDRWAEQHTKCEANFKGTSKAMEAEAAKRMWLRSVEMHGFRYTSILSDGDSSTFSVLQALKPYGDDHPITKLDCVNHAEKRLGSSLRKAMQQQRLGGRGHGRLTSAKAAKLQRYYGRAIRANIGKPDAMRKAIWASILHSVSTDEKPLHHRCPQGGDSWCIFNKATALRRKVPAHGPRSISTWLDLDIGLAVRPIYERMSDAKLLERMASGATENANESLHNLIWLYCPKSVFVGHSRVVCAVDMAVTRFNAGAKATSDRMKILGIEPTELQLACMEKEDEMRMAKAESSAKDRNEGNRKMRQQASKALAAQLAEAEGLQYGAGMF